jgi:hypothetical protein
MPWNQKYNLNGKSAYEEAVDAGFTGSEGEWLSSLTGPTGPPGPEGPQGPQGPPGGDPDANLHSLRILHGAVEFRGVSSGASQRIDFPDGYFRDGEPLSLSFGFYSSATSTCFARIVGINESHVIVEVYATGNPPPATFTAFMWWQAIQGPTFIRTDAVVVPPPPPPPPPLVDRVINTVGGARWKSWSFVSGAGTGQPFWDPNSNNLYYGYYNGTNGQQSSGWAMGGLYEISLKNIPEANVTGATLHFHNSHTFNNSGGTVRVYIADRVGDPLPNTQIPSSPEYMDVNVPKGGNVAVDLPLQWAKWLCGGGAANGFLFTSAVGGQAGYGYIEGSSVYVSVRYKG